jgi:hypothetical protein
MTLDELATLPSHKAHRLKAPAQNRGLCAVSRRWQRTAGAVNPKQGATSEAKRRSSAHLPCGAWLAQRQKSRLTAPS